MSRFAPDKVYNKPIGYKRNEVYQVTGSYYRASGKIPVVAFIVREGTGKVIILSKACLKPAKRAY
ncbi:MAG: hypothetical protein EBZ58_09855 [Bacteroidetes bacterium]|nr:hypothetical protein [Bacteroidota bacterium]